MKYAAEDTIKTLRAQQDAIKTKHLAHQVAWESINAQHDAKKKAEIEKMIERCGVSKADYGITTVDASLPNTSVHALQSMVLQLQK